jgi:hypothetical protein
MYRLSVRLSSVCPPICLSVCLLVRLAVCLSAFLSVSQPICLSDRLPVCLAVCLSVCLAVCLVVCLSVRLSVLSACLSCLPVYISACLPVCLSIRGIAELQLRTNISLKICGVPIAEVFPSSCGSFSFKLQKFFLQVAELRLRTYKKKLRMPHLCILVSALSSR